jgi:hypothetical protein
VRDGGRKQGQHAGGDRPCRDTPPGPAAAERVDSLAGKHRSVALLGQSRARALVRQQRDS